MVDGIEAAVGKRQVRAVGKSNPASAGNTICNRPVGGDPKSRQRKIDEHDFATARPGHIQPRPAGARPYIQEAQARP